MTCNLPNSRAKQDLPLLNAKEVAAWLGVTEDWVWDHSTRRAPYLPAIWLSNGALRFRRDKIANFIDERERLSAKRRTRR
jgi:predicted DNA-binding transcriptional regulator AlpA